jgi:hypothetical protein
MNGDDLGDMMQELDELGDMIHEQQLGGGQVSAPRRTRQAC